MLRKLLKTMIVSMIMLVSMTSIALSDPSVEMRMMKTAEKHDAFIEKVARLLHDKKEKEFIAILDPASIKGVNQEQIIESLKNDVFPFFAQYKEMKNYENVTNAQMADGRIGLWHYTFIVDNKGNIQPFRIAIIDTNDGLKVLSLLVGECVKGRHPAIPPCQ